MFYFRFIYPTTHETLRHYPPLSTHVHTVKQGLFVIYYNENHIIENIRNDNEISKLYLSPQSNMWLRTYSEITAALKSLNN